MMRRAPDPPACKEAFIFLREYDQTGLAALTGQDIRALKAFAHLVELYSVADGKGAPRAIAAMSSTVLCMQPHLRIYAKKLVGFGLDWSREDEVWSLIHAPIPV